MLESSARSLTFYGSGPRCLNQNLVIEYHRDILYSLAHPKLNAEIRKWEGGLRSRGGGGGGGGGGRGGGCIQVERWCDTTAKVAVERSLAASTAEEDIKLTF
jgi:hypothetical protein